MASSWVEYRVIVEIAVAVVGAIAVARKKRAQGAAGASAPGTPASSGPATEAAQPPDDYERMLVQSGDRDGAIKAYRTRTGAGASEARAAIGRVR